MDAIVMRRIAPQLMVTLLPMLVLLCCMSSLRAQQMPDLILSDPTRPATLAPGGAAGTAADVNAPLGQLQSVLIARSGRRVAVISGQTLRVGDKFGGAVVVSMSDNSVLLKKGSKVHALKLFPAPLERRLGAARGVEP